MRQRASTKTQRRLKQQQQMRDPYALTDDVYSEAPTFRVGGLVTAVGVLQLVAALTISGFVFGGALLVCAVVLAAVGLALLHHSDVAGRKQGGLGLKQAINRVLELRRSALDYSLTLSIAQSREFNRQNKQLQIAVVPSSPTPQKVVATMALKQQEATKQTKATTPLATNAPLVTLNRVDMKPLPTLNSFSVDVTEELITEKPRANSEPKQVLRSRPLLPLKPKVQQLGPVPEKKKKTQVKAAPVEMQDAKAPKVQTKAQPKSQPQKKPKPKAPKVAAKKETQLPAARPQVNPKNVIPTVLPKVESVAELPKPRTVEVAPTVVVEPIAPVAVPASIYPERKSLVETARSEPAVEKELVVTRKVLLYLNPNFESVVDLEQEDLEQENEVDQELGTEHDPENFALSLEAFPPLSPPIVPQTPTPLSPADVMEPNFLMDIELEPISKPEKKLISLGSLRLKPVGNSDLRSMLEELDTMRLELDTAMARCTSLLDGEEETESLVPSSIDLEPEEEPIFCC